MDVLAIYPLTLAIAKGTLERHGDELRLALSQTLATELRQLPALLKMNEPCGLVILSGDVVVPSRNGGRFQLTAPMINVHTEDSGTPPPIRVIEAGFSACFTNVTVEGERWLELTNPLGAVAATILATPAVTIELATASLATDKHLQDMVVYQAECYGIRHRGLVASYLAPLGDSQSSGVEPTISLWLNGSGDEHPLFADIPTVTH